MLKKAAGGLFVLAILGCVSIATRDVFVYVLCYMAMVAAVLFGLWALTVNQIWNLLPEGFKETHKAKKDRFKVIAFFPVPFFFYAGGVAHEQCLIEMSKFIRVLGYVATLIFTIFLGWRLLKRSKWKTIFVGCGVFILSVALLWFFGSTSLKSGKIAQDSSIEKLRSLGYVDWVPAGKDSDINKTGVRQYDPELAFEGLSLYNSAQTPEAYLIDMHGRVVHKWTIKIKGANKWEHVEMCENGDLIAIAWDQVLARLDWDSNVIWQRKMRAHHDVSEDENNKLYVLGREDAMIFWHGIPVPILKDYIAVLSRDGQVEKKVYVYDLVKEPLSLRTITRVHWRILRPKHLRQVFYDRLKNNYACPGGHSPFDLTHINSIEIMNRDIDGFCRRGDWLISIGAMDLVGIVDTKKWELAWNWGVGELDGQHHPTVLENGNVLIYDNGLEDREFSRIVELNPLTKKGEWEYKSQPPEQFFSVSRGSCQRLPNGNTLIAESDKGRVFEVTRKGKVVWEFYNPEVRVADKKRKAIYRMMRITDPEIDKLIKQRI